MTTQSNILGISDGDGIDSPQDYPTNTLAITTIDSADSNDIYNEPNHSLKSNGETAQNTGIPNIKDSNNDSSTSSDESLSTVDDMFNESPKSPSTKDKKHGQTRNMSDGTTPAGESGSGYTRHRATMESVTKSVSFGEGNPNEHNYNDIDNDEGDAVEGGINKNDKSNIIVVGNPTIRWTKSSSKTKRTSNSDDTAFGTTITSRSPTATTSNQSSLHGQFTPK